MKKPFTITIFRFFFVITSNVAPYIAVRVAEKLFTTPMTKRKQNVVAKDILEKAERFSINHCKDFALSAYR